jgi:hypothetical protein
MANDRSRHTLTDFMAEAISPALIMALVGSLIFFLVEVLYVGQYPDRLLWGLFFFVFAAVLIARISIESPSRATVYALLLAVPVWLTLQFYVEYPEDSPLAPFRWAVNIGLVAVIWWCAHRLTWDCTFIDEDADVSGAGLLEAAGLEAPRGGAANPAEEEKPEEAALGFWERYQRYRERRRKKHTPGVWVVYFSLAALPLFGLGQSLIPVEAEGRRRYVFWLMVVYAGSGLGLLLTTTFLGLRHYLRQRQVRMPPSMTGVWLTMGGVLVVALLAAGAFLPRPRAEYPLVDLAGFGSPERQASRWAMKGGSPGKGEGQPSSQAPRGEKNEGEPGGQGKQGEGQGQGREGGEKSSSGAQGEKNGSRPGDQQSSQGGSRANGQERQGEGQHNGRQSGQQGDGQGQRGEQGKSQDRSGEGQEKGGPGRRGQDQQHGERAGDKRGEQRQGQSGERASGQPRPPDETGRQPEERPGGSTLSGLLALLASLARFLKWVVFAVFALVVAFLVLRGVLQFLANFTNWARDLLKTLRSLWEGLFGWLGYREDREKETGEDVVQAPPPRPFASYTSPFRDGSADRLPTEKLVRYAFEAFQAWAWERDLGRRPDETPLEFAGRVGMEVPGLEADAGRLAVLYARVLYARGPLPASARAAVEQFWQRLEAVAEQPLSA